VQGRPWLGLWLASILGVLACDPAPQVTSLPLALRELAACRLAPPSMLRVTALGDFPSRSATVDPRAPSTAFENLPTATRELTVQALGDDGGGFGRRVLLAAGGGDAPLLLVPPARSCPLADDLVRAPEGAAVAALPDGGLLIAGGRESGSLASLNAQHLEAGRESGTTVPDGMLLRRAYASASAWDGAIVIAGGVADLRGSAHETYELFDVATGRFEASSSKNKLRQARMQHAAVMLDDGQLLLIGGRSEADGPPLSAAELLDLRHASSELLDGERGLQVARVAPAAFTLDSGSTLVLAGTDADARVVGSIEQFDAVQRRFQLRAEALPVRAEVAVAPLPGGRVAWLGCDVGPGATCALSVLFERAGGFDRELVPLPFADVAPNGLRSLRLLALSAGTLLLTAADDSDPATSRRAFLIDPSAGELTRVDATRVPSHLLSLSSGELVELDPAGASLRAAEPIGRYDSPTGNLLSEDSAYVVLDASAHWQRDADGLTAQREGARLDVPRLRFDALQLELESDGDWELIWSDAPPAQQLGLRVVDSQLQLGACHAEVPSGARLVLTRRASQLTAATARGAALCTGAAPSGQIGVGVRASAGAHLRWLSVSR
jgi:hypothetical protein